MYIMMYFKQKKGQSTRQVWRRRENFLQLKKKKLTASYKTNTDGAKQTYVELKVLEKLSLFQVRFQEEWVLQYY